MSEIIDSTYEIIGELGSGGGGVVYLAVHKRLGKKVVLKADKRNVNTRAVLLRREVDILKELHHTYIPQVYDYFIEDDTSYTVMDYVDGESLDKILKREGKLPQPTVIRWAKQLLEALAYLHSPTHGNPPRGYIHSDVKPANIMLRPTGDICLIDFNISLAIGIENVVGKSDGYSSPEHYGLDYSFGVPNGNDKTQTVTADKTMPDGDETELATVSEPSKSSSLSGSVKKVTPIDARSDIYSVGATLYHLLGGKKPNSAAKGVEPLSYKDFSPPLADIISKAMALDPAMRFHTADEMLDALNGLWKNDPRVKRQKRRLAAASSIFAVMLAAGGLTVFTGLTQMERLQLAYVMASESNEALSRGDVKGAVSRALEALPDKQGTFGIPCTAEAQLALTNALGVYDLSDSFKPYYTIDLPSAPFRMLKSPDEKRLLTCYAYELAIYDLETGNIIKTLPTLESALCEVEFIGDNEIIYAGKDGITAYNISSDAVLWQAAPATAIAVSGDRSTVAAIYGTDDTVNFYNAKDGNKISSRNLEGKHLNIPENDKFADPERDVFELNNEGTLCAVSLNGGYLGIMDISEPDNDLIIYDESDCTYFDGGFIGNIFAFSSAGKSGSLFSLVDCDIPESLGGMDGNSFFGIKMRGGKLYISLNDTLVEFNTETSEQTEIAYTENKNINIFDISDNYAIAVTDEGYSVFYGGAGLLQSESPETAYDFAFITDNYIALADRNSPSIEVLKLRNSDDTVTFGYDPRIEHDEARLNKDGSSTMLFDISGFTVINSDGSVKFSEKIPEPEKIYDQQYRKDGDYLEVTYYSGKVVCYSADSGEIISESTIPPPDDSLDEEFETANYIIKAPLHGAPEVYDKKSGKKIKELDNEDYLAYITETENYIIAQYVSADDKYYGVLMNGGCEPLARLPYLCDVSGDKLIFDFPNGNIKSSPIYELSELKEMADNFWD